MFNNTDVISKVNITILNDLLIMTLQKLKQYISIANSDSISLC